MGIRRIAAPAARVRAPRCGENGTQILELAVALPLLIVFVIGITDFGKAFTVKQKLSSAAEEGARFAANTPTSDLYGNLSEGQAPASVNAVASLVGQYVLAAHLADCGLASGAWSVEQSAPLTWTYTASANCPATLTLSINRGLPVSATNGSGSYFVISSQVTLSYPYQWQFNRVITLIAPNASYAGVSQIPASSVMANLN